MFLIHWPAPAHDRYVQAWLGLVRAREAGLVKSIGVSNFLPEHLERIISESGVVPVVNQIETHPEFQQRDIRAVLKRHNIQHESYSPLGSGAVLDNPHIAEIAGAHGKSPAQVIIRWHLQEGLIVIPKSVHADRIRENLEVFDFELATPTWRQSQGSTRRLRVAPAATPRRSTICGETGQPVIRLAGRPIACLDA